MSDEFLFSRITRTGEAVFLEFGFLSRLLWIALERSRMSLLLNSEKLSDWP